MNKQDLMPKILKELQKITANLEQLKKQPPAHTQGAVFSTATECNSDVGISQKGVIERSVEEQGFVEFTEQEIHTMPKNIKRLLIISQKRCHLRRKQRNDNSYSYEIRFRRDGYNVSACGKTIELAKANMLQKLKTATPTKKPSSDYDVPSTFEKFTRFFYDKHKKPRVAEQTFKNDMHRFEKHIFPILGTSEIKKITPARCQELIDSIAGRGLGKTKDECFALLNVTFRAAILYQIIDKNPMDICVNIKHETVNGKELTIEEQREFLKQIKGKHLEWIFALALFTGLRPNELTKARIEGDFVIAVNSKRKNQRTEYKKIYICKHLRPYLIGITETPKVTRAYIGTEFSKSCPGHTLKDLRRTFNSMCKELGVSDHARSHFMGHSLGPIGKAYTGLSDDYLRKEGKKLDEWDI